MVSDTWRARVNSFFTGKGLHNLSKALLQSGQVYYLSVLLFCDIFVEEWLSHSSISITIAVAIPSTALILAPSGGEAKPILGSVYFPLASAMACRVYRAVLLGLIEVREVNTIEITSALRAAAKNQRDVDDDLTTLETDPSSNIKIGVAVETETKVESPNGSTFWERSLSRQDERYDASCQV
jgi:hypothetical protein